MNRRSAENLTIAALAALLLAVLPALTAQSQDKAEAALKAAMDKETVDGNLKAAIEEYQKLAQGANKPVAARALVRLGECYEKQGNADARKTYEQVLSKFGDQKEAVAQARARLAALGGAAKPAGMTTRLVTGVPFTPDAASPDGRYLLHRFQTYDEKAEFGLDVFDVTSRRVRRLLVGHQAPGAHYSTTVVGGDVLFSPDSRQVAYLQAHVDMTDEELKEGSSRIVDAKGEIEDFVAMIPHLSEQLRVVNLDGSNDRVIAQFGANRVGLAGWFPDGKRVLAFVQSGAFSPSEVTQFSSMGVKLPTPENAPPRVVAVSVADGAVAPVTELPSLFGKVELSPDGKFAAYRVRTGMNPPQADVRLFSLADKSDVAMGLGPYRNISFEWTPDSNGIVYLSNRRGTSDLWYAGVANGKPQGESQMIKSGMETAALFPITRDGSYYYSQTKRVTAILTAEFDPATGKIVTQPAPLPRQGDAENLSPAFSPDGKTIAYLTRDPQNGRTQPVPLVLVLRSLTNGSERSIPTEFTDFSGEMRWSPDSGSLLVIAFPRTEAPGIYRIDAASGASTRLKEPALVGGELETFDISKDGKAMYYGRWDSSAKELHVTAWDTEAGSGREVLHTPTSSPAVLRVSPDDRQLAMIVDGSHSIETVPMAGGDRREIYRVAAPDTIGNIRWSPDGRYILLPAWPEKNGVMDLRRIPAEGGPAETILRGLDGMHGIWIHPDGRRLAFTRSVSTTELLALENFIPGPKTAK